MTTEILTSVASLVIATLITSALVGGYRWLRKLSAVVGQIANVTEQLGGLVETQAEQGRQIRTVRRELRLHVADCTRAPVRLPHPRAVVDDELLDQGA